jgi:hypothetical protein
MVPCADKVEKWERQKGEADRCYGGFIIYRELPLLERSLHRVASEVSSVSYQTIKEWSARWKWRERVEAWDAHVEQQRQCELIDQAVKMNARHAALAAGLLNAFGLPVQAMTKKLQKARELGIDVVDELSEAETATLLAMMIQASKVAPGVVDIERAARGQPVTPVEQIAAPRAAEDDLTADEQEDLIGSLFAFMEQEGIDHPEPKQLPPGRRRAIRKRSGE